MNVILECHDRDVTSIPAGGKNNGNGSPNEDLNTDRINEPQNYVWRKEGDPKNIIGHGKKLKLVKVDRWDNGVYYCSANVHAKESSGLDKGSSEKRHTAIHLEVAAPRVSSNLDVIKDLGLDTKSLENLRSTLHSSTSTISSSLHVVESSILGKKDALHKNNVLNQHAVFGDLGSSMSMSCKAEGEPIPNVRWYADRKIDSSTYDDLRGGIEVIKFSHSQLNDQTGNVYPPDSNPMQSSMSSIAIATKEGSSTEKYTYTTGEEVRTPDKSRGFNSHRIIREELKSGEEYAITINGYRDGGFESSLQIHNLQPHHFTKYYCEAQNSKGDDGLVIHLLKSSQQQKRRAHVLNAGNSSNNSDKYSSLTLLAQLIIILVCIN
jgi:hypothetical protein